MVNIVIRRGLCMMINCGIRLQCCSFHKLNAAQLYAVSIRCIHNYTTYTTITLMLQTQGSHIHIVKYIGYIHQLCYCYHIVGFEV